MKPIPILMYHSISVPPKNSAIKSITVTPRKFNRQMWVLKKLGWQGLSLTELASYLKGEKTGKVFGLTFDDGFQDNVTAALPILKKYQFTATCYLVADLIGAHNEWDLHKNVAKRKLMTETEIKTWIQSGCEIGSHTNTHRDLTKCNHEQLKYEIAESKQKLEQKFNCAIRHFCYPYGALNNEVVNHVKNAGYLSATTTVRSRAQTTDDFFQLPRVVISRNTPLYLFLLKVFGNYEDCKARIIQTS